MDMMQTPTTQPIKYPADGEKNTEGPPLPPDSKGAPINTNKRKMLTELTEFFRQSNVPDNITPKV